MSSWSLYVIFDAERDAELRSKLNSAMGSRVVAWSQPTPPGVRDWDERVRTTIERCDAVLVLCSTHTDVSKNVDDEFRITQKAGKPYFLVGVGSDEAKPPPSAQPADLILRLPSPRG